MALIKITGPNEIDDKKLMGIYSESNKENINTFFPQIKDKKEALKKTEEAFCNYMKTEFLDGKNVCYVWEDKGLWVSALRLYLIENNVYFLEALETAPNFRKKGYASQLLLAVIDNLKSNGEFKICDYVSKKNTASLNTHKKCGFKIVSETGYDYLQREYIENCYGLEYYC